MDARFYRAALCASLLLWCTGASYATRNFVVESPDPQFARQMAEAAEQYRRDLAVLWLGHELPNWSEPCPITVKDGPNLGAGGATTFVFDRGEVFGWQMTIQGSRERLLDSVLPHEITHMIFASHFRQPLPRWADEGGATCIEHISERQKHRTMLVRFLKTRRGIPFNRMFAMEEYPQDIMPLYAQGYSLAEYLIAQRGHRHYVAFLEAGLKTDDWNAAVRDYYGYGSLGDLQLKWVDWVAQGCPDPSQPSAPEQPDRPLLAAARNTLDRVLGREPNGSIYKRLADTSGRVTPTGYATPEPPVPQPASNTAVAAVAAPPSHAADGWLPLGSLVPIAPAQSASLAAQGPAASASAEGPQTTQLSHPQPVQQPHQIILQWSRLPSPAGTAVR
ncbi:hypothetical protein JCM19992_02570 [Thermostilla marina]